MTYIDILDQSLAGARRGPIDARWRRAIAQQAEIPEIELVSAVPTHDGETVLAPAYHARCKVSVQRTRDGAGAPARDPVMPTTHLARPSS